MTRRVFKYNLAIQDTQMLTIAIQRGNICLWALIDPEETRTTTRLFRLAGTGHKITLPEENKLAYVGTVMPYNGELVFHLFEVV
jgi:hypothetical protein